MRGQELEVSLPGGVGDDGRANVTGDLQVAEVFVQMGQNHRARLVLAHTLLETRQLRGFRVPYGVEPYDSALIDIKEWLGHCCVDGRRVCEGVADGTDTGLRKRQHECIGLLAPVVAARSDVLARGAQETLGMTPKERILVGGRGNAVSSQQKLVVEADAEGQYVSLSDDDPVGVGLRSMCQ